MKKVTIKVTAPAGRLIPDLGSFEAGQTFELDEEAGRALVAGATGLEVMDTNPDVIQPAVRDTPATADKTDGITKRPQPGRSFAGPGVSLPEVPEPGTPMLPLGNNAESED